MNRVESVNRKKNGAWIVPCTCLFMAVVCTLFTSTNVYITSLKIYISGTMFILMYVLICTLFLLAVNNKKSTYFDESLKAFSIAEFLPVLKFCTYSLWLIPAVALLYFEIYWISFDKILESNGISKRRMSLIQKSKCKAVSIRISCLIMSFILLAMITAGTVFGFFDDSLSNIKYSLSLFSVSDIVLNNEDDSPKFDKETAMKMAAWNQISREEKMEIHKKIFDIECKYLDISGISIEYEDIEAPTVAYYDSKNKTVVIGNDALNDTVLENINIICHECFHAFQFYTVRHTDFKKNDIQSRYFYRQVRAWKNNMENYTANSDDMLKYRTQPIEADAYAYGDERETIYEYSILLALKS